MAAECESLGCLRLMKQLPFSAKNYNLIMGARFPREQRTRDRRPIDFDTPYGSIPALAVVDMIAASPKLLFYAALFPGRR